MNLIKRLERQNDTNLSCFIRYKINLRERQLKIAFFIYFMITSSRHVTYIVLHRFSPASDRDASLIGYQLTWQLSTRLTMGARLIFIIVSTRPHFATRAVVLVLYLSMIIGRYTRSRTPLPRVTHNCD